ncbi:MAG: ABC transporter ATP-binding protein [Bacteroidota bacterium]|jgi:ABC-2 type transport system ATP-binding protein
MENNAMICVETKDLVKEYTGKRVLDHINISVPRGSIFGLLGPNGAGKTTLIRVINQITMPDSGTVFFMGEPLQPKHSARIGYLPEERGLYKKMSVGEQALYFARLKGMSKPDAMDNLIHWFRKFEIESWWNKKVEELSKGMQQKLQFIITVVHKPDLLILDEPFSGFDPVNAQLVIDEIMTLKNMGTTIILSTHNMGSVETLCEHIALVNQSSIVLSGKVNDIKKQYSASAYEIGFRGNLIAFTNAAWGGFELLDHHTEEGITKAKIKLLNNHTVSSLLTYLINHVEIHSIREIIPGMHEIFLQALQKKSASKDAGE